MPRNELPEVGIGTYAMTDPEVCTRSVETAFEVGYRHVDTAERYENEEAVGAALEATDVERDDVVVSTKIHEDYLAYDDVFEHARACRDRLGVDVIDLLYVHWPDETYDPEETLAAFDELREDGHVRHVGLSNFTPPMLERAVSQLDSPLFAHQVECHPLLQQEELRALAREHDHYLVAYSPLAKGKVEEVPELIDIAENHDATPAQVSLAWLLSKENVVVIPKSSTRAHIEENFEAPELELDEDEIERIDAIETRDRQVDFEDAPWR